jgi:hypothetical protein
MTTQADEPYRLIECILEEGVLISTALIKRVCFFSAVGILRKNSFCVCLSFFKNWFELYADVFGKGSVCDRQEVVFSLQAMALLTKMNSCLGSICERAIWWR